jgi:predicted RNA-binding protein YlxR (DUF448 family)
MSLSRQHVPFRMCIGCRSRKRKGEMIRFVRNASGSIVTGTKNLQGRGFYLCPDLTCLNTAYKRMRRTDFLKRVDLEDLSSRITRERKKQEDGE